MKIISAIFGAVAILTMPTAAVAKGEAFLGEYFITKNSDQICMPFAKNLNQFRKLDFDTCHPRLSEKYPQYTRPEWEEIPFDMALAERVARGPRSGTNPEINERNWRRWLDATASLRASEQLKMWRTRIDVDGDGNVETIVRLGHTYVDTYVADGKPFEQQNCPNLYSGFMMTESVNPEVKRNFNEGNDSGSDIIYDRSVKRYYLIRWSDGWLSLDGKDIGATRAVLVSKIYTERKH